MNSALIALENIFLKIQAINDKMEMIFFILIKSMWCKEKKNQPYEQKRETLENLTQPQLSTWTNTSH